MEYKFEKVDTILELVKYFLIEDEIDKIIPLYQKDFYIRLNYIEYENGGIHKQYTIFYRYNPIAIFYTDYRASDIFNYYIETLAELQYKENINILNEIMHLDADLYCLLLKLRYDDAYINKNTKIAGKLRMLGG